MTELRYITVGDIHSEWTRLKQVVNTINHSNVDFAEFGGDFGDMERAKQILDTLNKKYYVVCGNHDSAKGRCLPCSGGSNTCPFQSIFKVPMVQKYIIEKDNKKYQIIIPGICWSGSGPITWKFDFTKADPVLYTLVFNHGPIVKPPGCNWDSLHSYALSMKPYVDKLSVRAAYGAHVHIDSFYILNGRKYITNDSLTDRDSGTCPNTRTGHTDKIGYSRIRDYNPPDYKRIYYTKPFVDPFPV